MQLSVKAWLAFTDRKEEELALLLKGEDVNINIRSGNRLLHFACSNNDSKMVRWLLNQPMINVDIPNDDGWTPLHFAARNGFEDIVCLLMEHNANLFHPTKDGSFPIHFACAKGDIKICKYLIDEYATVLKHPNHNGWLPIHFACCNLDCLDIVEYLCTNYMDIIGVNEKIGKIQETPLHLAAGNGITETVKLLLSCEDVDPNQQDCLGRTPLHLAIGNNCLSIVKLFLDSDRVIYDIADKFGWTPLHFACRIGSLHMVENLVPKLKEDSLSLFSSKIGPEPFYIQKIKIAPIYIAAFVKNLDIVKILIPYTPSSLWEDNLFKENLWSCIDIKRSLLSESIRNDFRKENIILFDLIQNDNPLPLLQRELDIENHTIPEPFRKRPVKALRFCRELLYGSTIRKRFRLFIIGEDNVGKTKLVSKLSDHIVNFPIYDEEIAEISKEYSFLNISYWNANDIDFVLWKLRGNQAYSPNLDLFMKSDGPAAYFIVLDLTRPLNFHQILRFLTSIQSQSTPQSVFFVGTHIDILLSKYPNNLSSELASISRKLSGIILSWSLASTRYRNVNIIYPPNEYTFWSMDYSNQNDIQSLKLKILEVGIRKETSLLMPLSYATLFSTLLHFSQWESNTIAFSWNQFCEWGLKSGLKGEQFRDAALYFQLIGEIVYFDTQTFIDEEYIISNPIWLSALIDSMIKLPSIEMEAIWKKMGIEESAIEFIRNRILETYNLIPEQKKFYTLCKSLVHPSVWFAKNIIIPTKKNETSFNFGIREYSLPIIPSGMIVFMMASLYRLLKNNDSTDLKILTESKWNGFMVSHPKKQLKIIVTLLNDHIGVNVRYLSIYYYPLPNELKGLDKLLLSQIIHTLHTTIVNVSKQTHFSLKLSIGIQCAESSKRTIFDYHECEAKLAMKNYKTSPNGISIFELIPEYHEKSVSIPWEEDKLIEKFITMTQESGLPIYRAQYQRESVLVEIHTTPKEIFQDESILLKYRKFIDKSLKLRHKNLISTFFFLRPSLSIVVEYAAGKSLYLKLEESLKIQPDELFQIILDISNLLLYLHSHNPPIYHGGINQKNIIIPPNPILMDTKIATIPFETSKNSIEDDIMDFVDIFESLINHLDDSDTIIHEQLLFFLNTLKEIKESKLLTMSWIIDRIESIRNKQYFDIPNENTIEKVSQLIENEKVDRLSKLFDNGFPLFSNEFDFSEDIKKLMIHLIKEDRAIELKQLLSSCHIHPDSKLNHEKGYYLIHIAANNSSLSSLRVLLQYNANPDTKTLSDETALHFASVGNYSKEMVETLLEFHASPWIKNKFGSSPIMRACTKSSQCIPMLLNSKFAFASLDEALYRLLQLHYHKQESIILDQICLLLAQGASFNFNCDDSDFKKFVEQTISFILFNDIDYLPKDHLLWGCYTFFQNCPDDSFHQIQMPLVTKIASPFFWRRKQVVLPYQKISVSSLMLRFQRASINQGTVIYESNPIIVKNTAALSITVRFSIRQKSIHFIQMEPSEFTLSPGTTQSVCAFVIRTREEMINDTIIVSVDDNENPLQGYFLRINIPLQ